MPDLYFAYGSNMSSTRLRDRIPSARAVGVAHFAGHALVCNKRGKDGSGKANLVERVDASAWGVVFEVGAGDWPALDRFEWGYERASCEVVIERSAVVVQTYHALTPEPESIAPFDWYRDHCLLGAREHALPSEVVDEIASWRVRASEG